MLNIEIGNMTLGSAACCHSKDALDGIEFGQVSSYVTQIKWVTPAGDLAEASEADNPELLRVVRSSYGLCGVVYEVTLRVKPIEALHFTYLPRPVDELTQEEVDDLLDTSEGLICWTVARTAIFQHVIALPSQEFCLRSWQPPVGGYGIMGEPTSAISSIDSLPTRVSATPLSKETSMSRSYSTRPFIFLEVSRLLAPDKTIDYRNTP